MFNDKIIFGVDIGGTSIKLGAFDINGNLLFDWCIKTDLSNNGNNIIKNIGKEILEKINFHSIDKNNIIGIGVGIPGPISKDGTIKTCVNLGWKNKNIINELEAITNINVKVENDANVAALGEMWQGIGKGYSDIIFVTLGTGVGGGIIINKKLKSGTNGAAGEIGHITVSLNETEKCGCGKKGCLEQYSSANGIIKIAKKNLSTSIEYSPLREKENFTAKDVIDLAKVNDKISLLSFNESMKKLGLALANLAISIDPEIFIIGGGVSEAGDFLIDMIKNYYEKFVFSACFNTPIKKASLGNYAGIYGAAKLLI